MWHVGGRTRYPHPLGHQKRRLMLPGHRRPNFPHTYQYVSQWGTEVSSLPVFYSRLGPGDEQRMNSSVHLGSSLGLTQRSAQCLSQNRPLSDLQSFLPPSPPIRGWGYLHGGRVIRTECRGVLPTGRRFQRTSPIHRSHPGAGHLLNWTGLRRGTHRQLKSRTCLPTWLA